MKRAVSLLGTVTAVAAGVVAGAGESAASRVVDRTFLCNPIAYGGVRDLDVRVTPSRDDSFGRHFVASLETRTGTSLDDSSLVFVRARPQAKHPGLAGPWPLRGRAGAFAHSRRCTPSRVAVPLSSKGLPGPPIRWNKDLDCRLPGRVLVHVRAVLQAPTPWRRLDASYTGARRNVVEARLAVRSQVSGKPLAYMELDSAGRTKLWYSSDCS